MTSDEIRQMEWTTDGDTVRATVASANWQKEIALQMALQTEIAREMLDMLKGQRQADARPMRVLAQSLAVQDKQLAANAAEITRLTDALATANMCADAMRNEIRNLSVEVNRLTDERNTAQGEREALRGKLEAAETEVRIVREDRAKLDAGIKKLAELSLQPYSDETVIDAACRTIQALRMRLKRISAEANV